MSDGGVLNRETFFFSSRRRDRSWPRDWGLGVCSSDLSFFHFFFFFFSAHRRGFVISAGDGKSVVKGKGVVLGGRRIIKKKKITFYSYLIIPPFFTQSLFSSILSCSLPLHSNQSLATDSLRNLL